MATEKPSHKTCKIEPSGITASDGIGLASLFVIIILILLIAPITSMGAPPQPPGRLIDVGNGINMHIYWYW